MSGRRACRAATSAVGREEEEAGARPGVEASVPRDHSQVRAVKVQRTKAPTYTTIILFVYHLIPGRGPQGAQVTSLAREVFRPADDLADRKAVPSIGGVDLDS